MGKRKVNSDGQKCHTELQTAANVEHSCQIPPSQQHGEHSCWLRRFGAHILMQTWFGSFFFFYSGRSAEVGTVSSWILADGIMGIHSHQCVFYCINWYCWKYQANSQVCKPLLRSEIEAAIFRAKYKLRTNAQMLIRYVSIRPLFKGNVFGSCREERMGKRAENERHRKLKLNEAACHLGGGRGR